MTGKLPPVWIVVPTYWTHASGTSSPVDFVFDHPTPVDREGTLVRTLESFRGLRGEFTVLVVTGTSHPSVDEAAHRQVERLILPFAADFPLLLVSPLNLHEFAPGRPGGLLSLDSYGNIRNVQLAVPFASGAEAVVGIDDDEVIEDENFLEKVERFLGREFEGGFVSGMAGPYYDRNGDYRIPGAEDLAGDPNMFVKKNYFMDLAVRKAMESAPEGGITRSNVAFGGNMCFHRSLIRTTCHDPFIPRGEDYDYVINAAMSGAFFYFQPGMAITHLPPDSTSSQAGDNVNKLVSDIRRFIYMREKHRFWTEHFPEEAFDLDYLMPYPGVYLAEDLDLESQGVEALDRLYPEFRKRASPEALVSEAASIAREKAAEFFRHREQWRRLMKEMEAEPGWAPAAERFRLAPS